jgi:HTH-type transcriptional repressor of NAD biosynthesis genes
VLARSSTRKAVAPRVCVIGPELSGKTALARALAEHFNTVYVPEYARIYSIEKDAVHGSSWWPEEFVHMAKTQARFEAEAEGMSSQVMVCDTDAFSIWVWHRYYSQAPIEALRRLCDEHPADLYLLTSATGARDSRSRVRDEVMDEYRRQLESSRRRYVEVTGTSEERLARSIAAVEELIAH